MDPQTTKDGKPYGPKRYEEIVKECYLISKHCSTSYSDLMDVTPTERGQMLKFIVDELEKRQSSLEKAQQKAQQKKR